MKIKSIKYRLYTTIRNKFLSVKFNNIFNIVWETINNNNYNIFNKIILTFLTDIQVYYIFIIILNTNEHRLVSYFCL